MKKYISLFTFLIIAQFVFSQEAVGGIKLPQKLEVSDQNLVLAGSGVRSFMWMDMYVGAIYTQGNFTEPQKIIQADKSMGMRLHILSSLVSNKRIIKSLEEGFQKSTQGNISNYRKRIDQLVAMFEKDISPDDTIDLVYNSSSKNISVYRNQQHLGDIEGLDFKQALFGIWLSDDPANKSLKNEIVSYL
ncbi:MAG: chalcone isomerase family protein [Bacteroidota bacterium]